ncbi:MAG: hypothetical protein PHV82_08695, partial [Victivallaceae bacterium]|nr:hypothetical protein [Victivallaceae bacterium]
FEYCLKKRRLARHEKLFAGESVAACIFAEDCGFLCGQTEQRGTFFVYDVRRKMLSEMESFAAKVKSRAMIAGRDRQIYCSLEEENYIYSYCPRQKTLLPTGLQLPCVKGRRYLNGIDSLVMTGGGIIYGGTLADGLLFRFDPEKNEIVNLGKIASEGRISAVTLQGNKIYGVAGDYNPQHLFSYDIQKGGFEDTGLLMADPYTHVSESGSWKDFWKGYKFSSMTTGNDGKIYLGEYSRLPKIVIYEPGKTEL